MMTSKTVFISRHVFRNSPLCVDADYVLTAKSLIKFEQIPVVSFPDADWYFFYSRNGVYFGLRQLTDRSFFDNIKIATMGKGTALQLKEMTDRTPDFIGSGAVDHVSSEFVKVAKHQNVIFVRALNSLKSIQENLKDKLNGTDLVTYKNYIDQNVNIPETDVSIFTSPLNVEAYFKNKPTYASNILIALGKSTKRAILNYTDKEVIMPQEPSEASLKLLIDSILS